MLKNDYDELQLKYNKLKKQKNSGTVACVQTDIYVSANELELQNKYNVLKKEFKKNIHDEELSPGKEEIFFFFLFILNLVHLFYIIFQG
jgi:hypothetical protein